MTAMSRTRKLLTAIGMASLMAPAAAYAADQNLVDKLAPEIAKRCQPARGGGGVITASDLGRAIYASKVAPLAAEYDWNRKGGREIARMAFADDQGDNQHALNLLQHLAQSWTDPMSTGAADNLPFAAGGVEVRGDDGGNVPASAAQAVLAAILDGDDQAFQFRCPLVQPREAPTPAPVSHGPAIVVGKAPDDLSKVKLTDRAYAEVAYVSDRDAHKETFSFYGTIGLVWPDLVVRSAESTPEKGGYTLRFAPTLFTQIEREGSGPADPNDINNLNFGLQLGGFLQTRSPLAPGQRSQTLTHYFTINARYLTDTHFASSGWSVAAQVTPGIPIAGNNVPYIVPGSRLQLRWRLAGVVDHVSIDDPGTKAKLVGAPQYTRFGLDVTGTAKYFLGEDHEQALTLGIDYSLRQRLGTGVGNAQLLSGRLVIEPTPNFSLGIAYDRGENLDTLEHSDTVKLTFGIRR
jgi:hypothetical protein